jgi:hypothetical protein
LARTGRSMKNLDMPVSFKPLTTTYAGYDT